MKGYDTVYHTIALTVMRAKHTSNAITLRIPPAAMCSPMCQQRVEVVQVTGFTLDRLS